MDIGKNDIATIRKRLLQSKFQRIYLSSFRDQDTFVLKTNNGKDMLDEEHCISSIDVSWVVMLYWLIISNTIASLHFKKCRNNHYNSWKILLSL